jgi:hypothetical protein
VTAAQIQPVKTLAELRTKPLVVSQLTRADGRRDDPRTPIVNSLRERGTHVGSLVDLLKAVSRGANPSGAPMADRGRMGVRPEQHQSASRLADRP